MAGPHTDETKRRFAELVGSKGLTYEEAARAVGASESAGVRWMKEPELRAIAEEARSQAMDPTALGVLRAALTSRNEAIRLRAAALLLQNSDAASAAEPDAIPGRVIQVFPA
jgi:transposase-like protein